MSHPEYGSSWEAFSIEQILSDPVVRERWTPYFYRSHQGEEIDLILDNGMIQVAIECKASSSPYVFIQKKLFIRSRKLPNALVDIDMTIDHLFNRKFISSLFPSYFHRFKIKCTINKILYCL